MDKERIRNWLYKTSKVNLTVSIAILVLVVLIFIALLNLRMSRSIGTTLSSLHAIDMAVNGTVKMTFDHTAILRDIAEQNLKEPLEPASDPLFRELSQNPGANNYEIRTIPANYDRERMSYITGGGMIPSASSASGKEIQASIKLNILFADTKKNIPQATWIYYYSQNRFINMYPYEKQSGYFTWKESYLQHPLFLSVHPDADPQREIRWFPPYMDEGGKGLVTSILAPVYDSQDQFRGMVGMDFMLQTMNTLFDGPGLEIGMPILVDRRGQVLAQPKMVLRDDKTVKNLSEILPTGIATSADVMLRLKAGDYDDSSGWRISILDVQDAPWRILFLVNKRNLVQNTIVEMWPELVVLFLILVIAVFMDQRQRMGQKLRTYKAAVDSSLAAIVIANRKSTIQYVNQSFTDMTGYTKEESVGCNTNLLKSCQTPISVYEELWESLSNNRSWNGELLNRKKDGTLYWSNLKISPVAQNKDDGHYVAVMEDISEQKSLMQVLNRIAMTDELTGAASRRHFIAVAEAEIQRSIRYDNMLSLLVIDIDHFKRVNDQYGHLVGDQVLQEFSALGLSVVRKQDCFGRLGGEEFAVLLPEVDLEGAAQAAERIRQAVEAMEVITEASDTIKITCSIGATQRRAGDDHFQQMMARADIALYEAKDTGRNRVVSEKIEKHVKQE